MKTKENKLIIDVFRRSKNILEKNYKVKPPVSDLGASHITRRNGYE